MARAAHLRNDWSGDKIRAGVAGEHLAAHVVKKANLPGIQIMHWNEIALQFTALPHLEGMQPKATRPARRCRLIEKRHVIIAVVCKINRHAAKRSLRIYIHGRRSAVGRSGWNNRNTIPLVFGLTAHCSLFLPEEQEIVIRADHQVSRSTPVASKDKLARLYFRQCKVNFHRRVGGWHDTGHDTLCTG